MKFPNISSNLNEFFIYILLFSFYLSVVVPLLISLLKLFWLSMPLSVYGFFNRNSDKDSDIKRKDKDFKTYTNLVKEALSEKDEIKLRIVDKKKEELDKQSRYASQLSFFSFALLVLILIGISTTDNSQKSLIHWTYLNLFNDDENQFFIDKLILLISWYFLVVLAYAGIWRQIIMDKDYESYIYYPYEPKEQKITRKESKFD